MKLFCKQHCKFTGGTKYRCPGCNADITDDVINLKADGFRNIIRFTFCQHCGSNFTIEQYCTVKISEARPPSKDFAHWKANHRCKSRCSEVGKRPLRQS